MNNTGKISGIGWGFTSTGGRNLRIRYTLPSGQYFEQVAGQDWVNVDTFVGKNPQGVWKLQIIEGHNSE